MKWTNWALGLGIASIFLGQIAIIPIVTLGVSIKAIMVSKTEDSGEKMWKGITGLVLGGIYTLIYLVNFGYVG